MTCLASQEIVVDKLRHRKMHAAMPRNDDQASQTRSGHPDACGWGRAGLLASSFAIAVIAVLGREPWRVRRSRQAIAFTAVRANHSKIKKVQASTSQLMRLFRKFEPASGLRRWLVQAVLRGVRPQPRYLVYFPWSVNTMFWMPVSLTVSCVSLNVTVVTP